MQPDERVVWAAAWELARRLAGEPSPNPSRVAEAAMEAPGSTAEPSEDLGALEALARQVVEAVLSLSGRGLSPQDMARVVEEAARRYLGRVGGDKRALSARLAGEVPRLIDLPRLARLARRGLELAPRLVAQEDTEIVMGASPAFARVLRDLERVAETDFPVLLLGETGTGKELLARRLHQLSPRRQGPFVAVNCAAIPQNLLEAELFGHEKGAFTGAGQARGGYIQAAEGGTLFLDEIGETTPEFQVRLLRVLEDRCVTPVGARQPRRVDFRLVSASHRDLEAMAAQGRFHQALLYRILVVPIHLPPLRRRREDLPALIDHFLQQACLMARRTRRLAPQTRRLLMRYHWPGNVRQLSHVLQRLVALSEEYQIDPELLPAEIRAGGRGMAEHFAARLGEVEGVPEHHRATLARLLAQALAETEATLANRDVRRALGCSDSTAKTLRGALVRAGLLKTGGRRGGRRYRVQNPEEE